MKSPGDAVPDLDVASTDGTINLAEEQGTYVVYFYPKDDTPGCTTEACSFRDAADAYESAGVEIFGVSNDSVESHEAFQRKHGFAFPLIADTDGELSKAFGVYGEHSDGDFEWTGVTRTTFICEDGEVTHVLDDVNPSGHADEVLELVER
jgi:peroxiredoxin Q/BCP